MVSGRDHTVNGGGAARKSASVVGGARKIALRTETRLREATCAWRKGHRTKQIIFIHVPKSAGTSVLDYLQACIGGKKSGRTVKLDEFVLGRSLGDDAIRRGRQARFCTGHISWATAERLQQGHDAFVFTILRDPSRRLWSLYNYLHGNAFPASMIPRDLTDLYADITKMSPREFLAARDPRLHYVVDNVLVRQLSGEMTRVSFNAGEGKRLLGLAERTLEKLDFVGFTETFDRDFPKLIEALDLPPAKEPPRSKVSLPILGSETARQEAFRTFQQEVDDLMEPLVRWDRQLYEFAAAAFRAGEA